MKGEIPVFKRCCLFVPLRYGLLVWGYFKMVADGILITFLFTSMVRQILMIRVHNSDNDYLDRIIKEMIVPVIALAVFIVDLIATIVFIVGGHKKNVTLIRSFYLPSMVVLIFTLLLVVTSIVLTIQHSMFDNIIFWERTIMMLSFHIIVLVVQGYFLILLRSEIIKLRNNSQFKFVNNAVEAECTMTREEIKAEEETEREDI